MKRSGQQRLTVIPCSRERAVQIVKAWHRHHTAPPTATRFSLAVIDEEQVVRGVAIVGQPAARFLDDGWTLEVNRIATDGCENACSALYGASRRVAKELGFAKLITYIREDEPGLSLKAAGWTFEETTGPHSWVRPNRWRTDKTELVPRGRWGVSLADRQDVTWPEVQTYSTLSLFEVASENR